MLDSSASESEIISELGSILKGVEADNLAGVGSCKFPTSFIVGCPRSGTTALLQYLAACGAWAYPTNFLTRMVSSPYVALLIQELLISEKFGMLDRSEMDFSSEFGRSKGAFNANEFFHFWRRFFPHSEIRHLSDSDLSRVDINEMERSLALIEKFCQKPILAKNMMLQFNIQYFSKALPKSIFVYIKRDPIYTMQSIYIARTRECASVNDWWSAKPRAFKRLCQGDVFSQIAGQVYYSNREIQEGLALVPDANKLIINYEDFVIDPESVFEELRGKYRIFGVDIASRAKVSRKKMVDGNQIKLDQAIIASLASAYAELDVKTA